MSARCAMILLGGAGGFAPRASRRPKCRPVLAANQQFATNTHRNSMKPEAVLRSIKLFHTAIWLLFALFILGIPILGYLGRIRQAAWLVCIVLVEVLVLVFNGLRCPLTDLAARYTTAPRD